MNEMIWINGDVMPLADARVGVEDRGYQFADGVYEVIRLYDGRPFTLREHLERLEKSAAGIQMELPMTADARAFIGHGVGVAQQGIVPGGGCGLERGCFGGNHPERPIIKGKPAVTASARRF